MDVIQIINYYGTPATLAWDNRNGCGRIGGRMITGTTYSWMRRHFSSWVA